MDANDNGKSVSQIAAEQQGLYPGRQWEQYDGSVKQGETLQVAQNCPPGYYSPASRNGRDGKDGKYVQMQVNEAGVLYGLTTDNKWESLGKVRGGDGKDGTNGKDGANGVPGKEGRDGKNGTGIVAVAVNADNHLLVTYSDGTQTDAGKISVPGENLELDFAEMAKKIQPHLDPFYPQWIRADGSVIDEREVRLGQTLPLRLEVIVRQAVKEAIENAGTKP